MAARSQEASYFRAKCIAQLVHGSVLLNLAAHGAAQAGKAPLNEGLNAGMQNFAHLAVDTVIAVGGHCSDLVAGVYILHVHTLQGHPKLIRHLQRGGYNTITSVL